MCKISLKNYSLLSVILFTFMLEKHCDYVREILSIDCDWLDSVTVWCPDES